MAQQRCLHVEPLGALGAVVSAEAGQVLDSFGVFELLEMFGREEVGFDLVEVSVGGGISVARGAREGGG